ncbi:MAG TPA: CvpA family protein [Aggregatilinea sp.]|uniref:CvpA family protein n=1 Tax=Aggregatilinea sp. TaxID=2806333 RepID=UPI002BC1F3AD|nr:CvpA family protein [Aggregatilinea sp.]HML22968.1 CvpA family protein [Aggregatilinea sp.]
MIQLSSFLYFMIGLFAVIGFMRGWTKELIATAGIVLALFALRQFETIVIDPLTDGQQQAKFYLQAAILVTLAVFAYQTPPDRFVRSNRNVVREGLQEGILGALIGGLNGYLLIGSLWWYMDNLEYPLSPNILPVVPGSASANLVSALPLSWMLSGDGNVLSLLMIGLFVFVIVAII